MPRSGSGRSLPRTLRAGNRSNSGAQRLLRHSSYGFIEAHDGLFGYPPQRGRRSHRSVGRVSICINTSIATHPRCDRTLSRTSRTAGQGEDHLVTRSGLILTIILWSWIKMNQDEENQPVRFAPRSRLIASPQIVIVKARI